MGLANRLVLMAQPEFRAAIEQKRQAQVRKRVGIPAGANNRPLALLRSPGDPMLDGHNSCARFVCARWFVGRTQKTLRRESKIRRLVRICLSSRPISKNL
jgi:hypothetical protein